MVRASTASIFENWQSASAWSPFEATKRGGLSEASPPIVLSGLSSSLRNLIRGCLRLHELARAGEHLALGAQANADPCLETGLVGQVQCFIAQPAGALHVASHGMDQCHMRKDPAGACLVTALTADENKLLESADRRVEVVEIARPRRAPC